MEETVKKKKYAGRKKGTPNKRTLILQEHLDTLKVDPIQGLKDCLDELELIDAFDPIQKISLVKSKASIYMELLQYIYPKRKAIEMHATIDQPKKQIVQIQWADENDNSEDASSDAAAKTDQSIN